MTLKKEAFWALLDQEIPEAAARHHDARWAVVSMIAETLWEEFGEVMGDSSH